jgi:hypothetical protein
LQTVLADALLDANDLDAALPLTMEGLAAPREFGNAPPLVLLASLPVVRLRLAEGDPAGAEAALAEVRPEENPAWAAWMAFPASTTSGRASNRRLSRIPACRPSDLPTRNP